MGNKYFHSKLSNWSIRKRGNVHRIHKLKNTSEKALAKKPNIRRYSRCNSIKCIPTLYLYGIPSTQEERSTNTGYDKHI